MQVSRRVALSFSLAASAALFPGPVHADVAGDKLCADMDAALNRAKTHTFEYEVINQEAGKPEKKLMLKVQMKGEKRLVEFSAPADMKGTKLLILSPTQMYVYLPAFGKVRRIASQAEAGGFMGLAFGQDDLATSAYCRSYGGQISASTPTQATLVLTPKAGAQTQYGKIEILVNKDRNLPAQLKYFDSAGKNTRTETRSNYTCEGNICSPGVLKMVDQTKGRYTQLSRKSWKVTEEIADDVFTQRSLEK